MLVHYNRIRVSVYRMILSISSKLRLCFTILVRPNVARINASLIGAPSKLRWFKVSAVMTALYPLETNELYTSSRLVPSQKPAFLSRLSPRRNDPLSIAKARVRRMLIGQTVIGGTLALALARARFSRRTEQTSPALNQTLGPPPERFKSSSQVR